MPESVKKLIALKAAVVIESGAGTKASRSDDDYREAGAQISDDRNALLQSSDVVVAVNRPEDLSKFKPGTVVIGFLRPLDEPAALKPALETNLTTFAMELVPRITRAQSMDALSSMATVACYKAVIIAAERSSRMSPLLMTAAGTVPPAKVLVLGAGVAGLQAIATARRLGAVVEAYDVRAAAAEEVRSMGATFVELDLDSLEGTGGYAREMTEDRAARQRDLLAPYVAASDALILTAAVPGRRAPLLVTGDMIAGMKPGSIVVDLAAESGGNCDVSVAGEEIQHHGVAVWGARDVPSQLAVHSSKLYSANVTALLALLCGEAGALAPRWEDEIVAGCWVTRDGALREGITFPEGG